MHPSIQKITSAIKNRFFSERYELIYVTEAADWTIKGVGQSLVRAWNELGLISARISATEVGCRFKIVHFGSINTFLTEWGHRKPRETNRAVVTWFHVLPMDPKLRQIKSAQYDVNFIHTASNATRDQLLSAGVRPEKIIVIPLGVDTRVFRRSDNGERESLRAALGIRSDEFVIGSFQKDGEGWGLGLKPKLIKGPDVLVETAFELAKHHKIHLLLTGPARGYVKNELTKHGIAYTHVPYLRDNRDIAQYYRALDVYLGTARIEGGPMQIFESWASGIPYVGAEIGLLPDVATDGHDAIFAPIGDTIALARGIENIIEDPKMSLELVTHGLQTVKKYDWRIIAKRYYDELYKPLL